MSDTLFKYDNADTALTEEQNLSPASTSDASPAYQGKTRVFAQPSLIHQIFEERIGTFPLEGQIKFANAALGYPAANARANQLARWLRGHGIGQGDLVGVCLEPCIDLIVTLLAILKTGAGFVPLDPSNPRDRLEFATSDSRVKAVLHHGATRDAFPIGPSVVLDLDIVQDEILALADGNLDIEGRPDDVIYVMYTSGSTGSPKGAILTHAGIRNRLLWGIEEYDLNFGASVLFKTSIAFDVCIWEIFAPLLSGADLIIAKQDGGRDVPYLVGLIREHEVTHADFVPSMMSAFLSELEPGDCANLRVVTCAGESLTAGLLDQIFAALPIRVYNLYGPTEASLAVTYWSCTATPPDREVPIGHPMVNIALYVLDAECHPVPEGQPGELYIGGIAPGLGYLNLPAKTADSFVADRFSGAGTLYRTGDMVRARPDGSLMFLGRADQQIKLRGVRIELGEIEARLANNPLIRDAVVSVREFGADDQRLVAYVTLHANVPRDDDHASVVQQLRLPLQEILPIAMIPAHFMILEIMPLMSNGKADRKALTTLPISRALVSVQQTGDGDITQEVEERMIGAWCEVLGLDRVTRSDDFFALGGHSLLAVKIVSRLKPHFKVSVADLFEHRTIQSLTQLVVSRRKSY